MMYSEPPTLAPEENIKVRTVGTAPIGRPIHIVSGQFAGSTIRAELDELQKANVGRKFARKDRRPLDPPPIVRLRFFRVLAGGREEEVPSYDVICNAGILCHLDLFPVPDEEYDKEYLQSPQVARASGSAAASGSTSYQAAAAAAAYADPLPSWYSNVDPQLLPPDARIASPQVESGPSTSTASRSTTSHRHTVSEPHIGAPHDVDAPQPPHQDVPQAPTRGTADDVVAYWGDHAITEGSKRTNALSGATFVSASLLDYKGDKSLLFVLSDLAVKVEGRYILRYRAFDSLSVVAGPTPIPVFAECYGGPFRIYSSKNFPGLKASTDLTKHISRFGVRLNSREQERKRRKKEDIEDAEGDGKGKGKICLVPIAAAPVAPLSAESSSVSTVGHSEPLTGTGWNIG
ncbi:hypothetical protein WOLCODRAFT_161530 [Wolfiporia cocos MD-104 SS10]|uniref:Velvet domain-containing protein n=1 Tax=Wolfiporia cocos (strain MD-104) TaxID=742152 RepID=A0A2H3J8Y1_WOLCO|nr:hypothetical protein WOLCODRAFT_161530 [Wolfiporia cocos MD-104 SS10]